VTQAVAQGSYPRAARDLGTGEAACSRDVAGHDVDRFLVMLVQLSSDACRKSLSQRVFTRATPR